MPMAELKQKVMESVRTFKAQPKMINERIHYLIDADYMERDPNDRTRLVYLP
jgi:hypothetical protein